MGIRWIKKKVGDKIYDVPSKILKERRVPSIVNLMDTAKERVAKQLSHTPSNPKHILPLHRSDDSTSQVQRMARDLLLRQRSRAAATYVDKNGIPPLHPQNGIGHFVLPLQRIHLSYCSHNECSRGLRDWMEEKLPDLASKYSSVEFVVEPRWGHAPLMRAHYLNDRSKVICVRNCSVSECGEVFEKLINQSGNTLRPFHQGVKSRNMAVRSIWSPFHALQTPRNAPLSQINSISDKKQLIN